MNQVSEILGDKGHEVLEIEAGASVLEAVKRMVEANIGSLLVRDAGEVAGIVTERDYLRSVALEDTDEQLTVREIMSSPLVVVNPETTIDECMALMTDRRIRHVPVVGEEGEVLGIVSIGDVVKFKSKQQSFEIRYLTDYITAG
jgi:CBS domain-containing protein